jgi:hypothetical protein
VRPRRDRRRLRVCVRRVAAIDCCAREICARGLELRCRAQEAIEVVERGVGAHGIDPGRLTLGSDNGTAITSGPSEPGRPSSGSPAASAATATLRAGPSSSRGSRS